MNVLANTILVVLLASPPADDLGVFLASVQQSELTRVQDEMKAAQRSKVTRTRQEELRRELRAIKAGAFALPRLRPEKLAVGAIGVLYDPGPAPHTEVRGSRSTREYYLILNQIYEGASAKMSWNTFHVDRVFPPRDFVAVGREASFLVRGLDAAKMGAGQEVKIPQLVRVIGPEDRTGSRLLVVEVVDQRPAAEVLKEWAKKSRGAKNSKPALDRKD